MDTFMQVRPALAILAVTVAAALTLRHLLLFRAELRNMPRYGVQPVLIVLTLLCSTILITGTVAVDDTVHAGLRAGFRTTSARNLGNVDEIVTAKASQMERACSGAYTIRPPYFFPATMADRLRTGLASSHTVAGVAGAIMLPVAFQDHASGRTTAYVELLGVPVTYPTAFGPLTTVPGTTVTLGRLDANQVYINQAAAQALGARAGDRLQLLIGGRPVPTGPTTLYFAEGDTGQNGQATFEETLAVRNTGPFPATATLTYLIEGANPLVVTRVIPPHATLRESVNGDVGPERSVAAVVASPSRLTVQRLLRRRGSQQRVRPSRSPRSTPGDRTRCTWRWPTPAPWRRT